MVLQMNSSLANKFNILDHLSSLTIVKETDSDYHCKCPLCGDGGFKINKASGKYNTFKCQCNATPEGKEKIIEAIAPRSTTYQPKASQKQVRLKCSRKWRHEVKQGGYFCVTVHREDDGQGGKQIWQTHVKEEWHYNPYEDEEQPCMVELRGLGDIERSNIMPYVRSVAESVFRSFDNIISAKVYVFIVEGQPCVDALEQQLSRYLLESNLDRDYRQILACTNINGAGKWIDSDTKFLLKKIDEAHEELNYFLKNDENREEVNRTYEIVLCPDRDKPGLEHMISVAKNLIAHGVSKELIRVFFPYEQETYLPNNLPLSQGLDIMDWLEANNMTASEIIAKIETLPDWLERLIFPNKFEKLEFFQFFSEAMLEESEDIEWLIPDLIVKGSNMIAAQSGCGKSILASNLAIALTQSGTWLGHKVPEPMKVLYHCSDEREVILKNRLSRQGFKDSGERKFASLSKRGVSGELWSAKNLEELEDCFDEFRPDLFVIDSVRSTIAQPLGLLETSEEIGAYVKKIIDLCERYGVASLFVHHDKKGDATSLNKVAGHSSLVSPLDVVLRLERVSSNAKDPRRKLTQPKNRCGEQIEMTIVLQPETMTYSIAEDDSDDEEGSAETKKSAQERILEYLDEHPKADYKELMDKLGVGRSTAFDGLALFKKLNPGLS